MKQLLLLSLAAIVSVTANAADPAYQRAIGLQLMITAEPFDAGRNRWEVNIAPLIYQQRFNDHWQLKLMPLINLRLDPGQAPVVSHVGLGIAAPYHFEQSTAAPAGAYVGPHLGYSYNLADGNQNVTLAGEVGYAFRLNDAVILNVAGEFGTTWFDQLYTEQGQGEANSWLPHFGIKPQLSIWY